MSHPDGLVFSLPAPGLAALADALRAREGRAIAATGCELELLLGDPRVIHAIVTWKRAVPLKVERLAVAIMAAGGRLDRTVGAESVRRRAVAQGRRSVVVRDLEGLRALHAPALGRTHSAQRASAA